MNLIETPLPGLFILEPRIFEDIRGKFIKTFHQDTFAALSLETAFVENYYTISAKHVIRGMHFQTPPHDLVKLVYVPAGRITDVVLDLRKASPTFGKHFSIELSAENGKMIYIPKGLAHGFVSHEDGTNVTYMQTSMYAPEHDAGIRYDSFGFDWGVQPAGMSDRDKLFEPFEAFDSPFKGSLS